ncbi:MAG: ferritin-like domain-containing protein [Alphaproteobacteria bacterium]
MPDSSIGEIAAPRWEGAYKGPIRLGSPEHRDLFCRMLLDTFDPYKPQVINWPKLEGDALLRLTSLPFWTIAVETEGHTAMRMQTIAEHSEDRLIGEAIALNAFEERRHKEVLENMVRFYGIKIDPDGNYPRPDRPVWAYMSTGYGECFDSFFSFGLFKVARDSGFFPKELVEVFEPIIQEEARHILFFVNWAAYSQRREFLPLQPLFAAERFAALSLKAWNRLKFARGGKNNSNMTMKGHEAMGIDLSPRSFLQLCLAEDTRRMARYDSRLVRPRIMPRLVRMALPFLPKK